MNSSGNLVTYPRRYSVNSGIILLLCLWMQLTSPEFLDLIHVERTLDWLVQQMVLKYSKLSRVR